MQRAKACQGAGWRPQGRAEGAPPKSEITACRHDQLTGRLRAVGVGAIADLGFVALDDSGPDADPVVITGYKAARNRPLIRGQKPSTKALAAVRAPVEHGFAHLKNWRVLTKVRAAPKWVWVNVPQAFRGHCHVD
ncbi:hypothetical protein [Streptomyces sp. AC558_RSS880]|uniref:hypothetical protein n=1 Tax=Streptomyces sp. AC558_RSS880 TaxID=2823687 RepID=UPI0020B82B2A|nr:hypothetical protein [Streptomyces sp. AC558_RSS880]